MKRLILALALACGACTTIPAPGTVANQTVLDERTALAVELAYKAARLATETATDAGLIRGATAATVARLDRAAYGAVGAVRSAYQAGNAADYLSALTQAQRAVQALVAALEGVGR